MNQLQGTILVGFPVADVPMCITYEIDAKPRAVVDLIADCLIRLTSICHQCPAANNDHLTDLALQSGH